MEPVEVGVEDFAGPGESVVENLTFAGALRIGEETMAILVGGAQAMAKKKSFRSGPRLVSDNDRYTLLIVDSWLPPYASPAGRRCFMCREKGKTGSSLPRWPFRRQKAGRQAHASSHLHRARPRQTQPRTVPRAMVLVNACCRTLTAFSQGDWPLTCANAAYTR